MQMNWAIDWTLDELAKEQQMWEAALPATASVFAVQHANKQAQLYRLAAEALRFKAFVAEYDTPPSDWKPFDASSSYCGFGKRGEKGYVDEVDDSNNGDIHSHGYAAGGWSVVKDLRVICGLEVSRE
jgi:hypothetical protein